MSALCCYMNYQWEWWDGSRQQCCDKRTAGRTKHSPSQSWLHRPHWLLQFLLLLFTLIMLLSLHVTLHGCVKITFL